MNKVAIAGYGNTKFTDTPVWITRIGQKTLSAGFTKSNNFEMSLV